MAIKKENLFLILLISLTSLLNAQKLDSDETIDCIKKGLVNFYIDVNRINDQETDKSIGIVEIIHNKIIGYSENGIYRFTDHTTHMPNYLLLKAGTKYKVLTLYNIKSTYYDALSFLERYDFSDKETLKYIEQITTEIKNSYSTIWSEQMIPREQKWIDCDCKK